MAKNLKGVGFLPGDIGYFDDEGFKSVNLSGLQSEPLLRNATNNVL